MSYQKNLSVSEPKNNTISTADKLKTSDPLVRVRRLSLTKKDKGRFLKRNKDKIQSPPPSPLGKNKN